MVLISLLPQLLLDLARSRNANPLPPIKANQYGIRLPPDRYCLAACNYKLKPSRKVSKNAHGWHIFQ